jgi:hypothetical protein
MSIFNASMDIGGFYISGQGGPVILPDPVDLLNVKTLNIVDENNDPYYTMPQEPVLINNSVAVFNIDGTSSLQPYSEYPINPSCFGWHDCGFGVIPPNTITITKIIPSFTETNFVPLYNNPISTSFVFNQATGVITCNEAGIYLIQQSFNVRSNPNANVGGWVVGLYNNTSGRAYKAGAPTSATITSIGVNSETTYDTLTAGTEIFIYGTNSDPVNEIIFDRTYITIFRLA